MPTLNFCRGRTSTTGRETSCSRATILLSSMSRGTTRVPARFCPGLTCCMLCSVARVISPNELMRVSVGISTRKRPIQDAE